MSSNAFRSVVRLWRSESSLDTYLAILLVVAIAAPYILKYISQRSTDREVVSR